MQQVVCTKCRCSNQFGTIFCRNCGKKLPELDMNHPDRKLQNGLKDIFKRFMKLVLIVALIALIGAIILPVGFKKIPSIAENKVKIAERNYELMAKRIAEGAGVREFVMTPAEAGYIATKFITPTVPNEREKPKVDTAQASESVDAPVNPGVITCSTEKDEITLVYTKKYYKVLQCRIEITGTFVNQELDDSGEQNSPSTRTQAKPAEFELTYTMTKARLGHIPMPKLLFPHVMELFRTMVFTREIERAVTLVEDVKVDNDTISLSFKRQIK